MGLLPYIAQCGVFCRIPAGRKIYPRNLGPIADQSFEAGLLGQPRPQAQAAACNCWPSCDPTMLASVGDCSCLSNARQSWEGMDRARHAKAGGARQQQHKI